MEIDLLKDAEILQNREDLNDLRMTLTDLDSLHSIYKQINHGYSTGNFDEFFTNFNLLVSLSDDYTFGLSDMFIEENIVEILKSIIMDENLDLFLREQALKLIINLTTNEFNNFSQIFAENGLLQAIDYVLKSNAKELYNKAISCFINMSYSSDEIKELIYQNFGFETIFHFLQSTDPMTEEFSLATRLFYTLAKTIKEEDNEIVFQILSFLLNNENKEALNWGFWTAALICSSKPVAMMMKNIPNFSNIITKLLKEDNDLKEPIINLILQIHTFTDEPIEGFAYENLIDFLKNTENDFSDSDASIFANIMTNPEATQYFIENGYLIFFVDAYHSGSFSTQLSIIRCFYNSLMTVPSNFVVKFIEDGVVEVLIESLHLSSIETLVQSIYCFLTLLYVPIAKEQFLEFCEPDSFDDIEEDDSPQVQELYQTLQESYPDLFTSE